MSTLPTYSFLPWVRLGIANSITAADSDPSVKLRAQISIDLQLSLHDVKGKSQSQPLHQSVQLYGPGDIVGIAANAIVKTEPRKSTTSFEPNRLAHIEFYDEDFPWRYTPAAPNGQRLRPWITLVVLAEAEFDEIANLHGRPLPGFKLKAGLDAKTLFPPGSELWAWAHVHVNQAISAPEAPALSSVLADNPDLASARIVCPRRLAPSTRYEAFLIPTFEAGRLAGTGAAIPPDTMATALAWGSGQNEFPYYYRFGFRTSVTGDFEYLVSLLKAQPVDKSVGVRDLDVLHPGATLPAINTPSLHGVLQLGGALRVPRATMDPPDKAAVEAYDAWDQPYPDLFETSLAALVNRADDYLTTSDPDPTIAPPIYGRWPALTTRLLTDRNQKPIANQHNWVHALNLDPRYRVAAGLGTRVVQSNQETLMSAAWQQVGAVLEANAAIRRAQLARAAAMRLHTRHLMPLEPARQLAVTAPVQPRVMSANTSVRTVVAQSTVPYAVMSPAFRRMTRPRAQLATRLGLAAPGHAASVITQLASGQVLAAQPWLAPAGALTQTGLATQVAAKATTEAAAPNAKIALAQLPAARAIVGGESSAAIAALPKLPTFVLARPALATPASVFAIGAHDSDEATRFKSALADAPQLTAAAKPAIPNPLDVATLGMDIVAKLDPAKTIPARAAAVLGLPARITAAQMQVFVPAMVYPQFDQPMYKPLTELSADLFLPNINKIPQNSITLLETNQAFIESYMVGLNHELARELLWREYPTDQRGSYFRQFWDVSSVYTSLPPSAAELEKLRDIPPLDKWSASSALGSHDQREGNGQAALLVLVVRGELLKRYPTAVIYAQRAVWGMKAGKIDVLEDRKLVELTNAEQDAPPHAKLRMPLWDSRVDPDIYFIGFDLTAAEAVGSKDGAKPDPGWFFVIHERPGEPMFGMNEPVPDAPKPPLVNWDRLGWDHVGVDPNAIVHLDKSLTFAPSDPSDANIVPDPDDAQAHYNPSTDASQLGYILLREPAMIAVHASRMLA